MMLDVFQAICFAGGNLLGVEFGLQAFLLGF
jgi:hypothetical protein